MKSLVGTSGFSYPEWRGVFYPEKLRPADFLGYYASRLQTVEINNTFYRLPRAQLLEGWRDKTPEGFLFSLKASRRITHFRKLKDTGELLGFLAGSLGALGSRLGPVLFQTPPTLRADLPLLEAFLGDVEQHLSTQLDEVRIVLEFRHPSWLTEQVEKLLAASGIALCGSDGDDEGRVPTPLLRTARFTYLRLRKQSYSQEELLAWATALRDLGVEEAFVYFKHEETGPDLALQLRKQLL